MGFTLLGQLLSQFIEFASQIIFRIIVFAIGLLVASLAARLILASNVTLAGLWAMVARIAILFLAGAIALRPWALPMRSSFWPSHCRWRPSLWR
jgi:hypothetical protein